MCLSHAQWDAKPRGLSGVRQRQILLRAERSLAAARKDFDSTFPLTLQLLVALYERAHRAVQVPRKTPRHLAFAFQLLNRKGGDKTFPSTLF